MLPTAVARPHFEHTAWSAVIGVPQVVQNMVAPLTNDEQIDNVQILTLHRVCVSDLLCALA
jgi:hypothetical protein